MVTYRGDERVPIPRLDTLSFLYESDHVLAKEDTDLHVEASNPSNKINKSQARSLIKRIAFGLRKHYGIGASGPGKDVVVCSSNGNPLVPIFFYGVIAAGGIFSSASTAFTKDELVRQVQTGDGAVLACTADQKEKTINTARECGILLEKVLVLDYSDPAEWAITPLEGQGRTIIGRQDEMLPWKKVTDLKELEDTVVCLLFSSGTTGKPKGVMLTHRNLVASAVLSMHPGQRFLERKRSEGNPFRLRTIAHLPVAHIAGIQQYFLNPMYYGGTTFWMAKYNFDTFIEASKTFKATYLFSVPPIWLQIAKSDKVRDHFRTMEVAITGAAPMGPELQKAAGAKLGKGGVFIGQTWGLTETTGSVTVLQWDEEHPKAGSVSPLAARTVLELKDDDGKDVGRGEAGELVIGGPLVAKGYYKNEEATREAFKNGSFFTGDIGLVKDGHVYIVDRKKELIKYKGLQVPPAELEALLMSHDQILDAAVIGIKQDDDNEVPRAYIVKRGEGVTAEGVKKFVKDNLAPHKQLRGGVVFIDEIPKSASGKILRRELRERAAKELQSGKSKL